MNFTLTRFGSIPEVGTPGVFTIDGQEFPTIEREWKNNRPFESCVPIGKYRILPIDTDTTGGEYALYNPDLGIWLYERDIPPGGRGRYRIIIHVANIAAQLAGCVAAGVARGYVTVTVDKERVHGLGVASSTIATNTINNLIHNAKDPVYLDIQQADMSW